jgi:hypothetical protein
MSLLFICSKLFGQKPTFNMSPSLGLHPVTPLVRSKTETWLCLVWPILQIQQQILANWIKNSCYRGAKNELRELISQLTETKKVKTWLRGRRKGLGLATSRQLTVRALPARTAVSQGQSTVRPFLEKKIALIKYSIPLLQLFLDRCLLKTHTSILVRRVEKSFS